ncbi:ABC transporter permease [Geminicoccaceae bacterium 1502E]|nr:ABC transporter permease [Geminicoccaceae bacterium 1502E]
MSGWLLRRLVETFLLLLLVSFLVYGLIGLMPGDPIDLMIAGDPRLGAADAQRLKALAGLDRPLVERWLGWLGRALAGEFGYSRLYSVPAVEVLWPRLLNTLLLMGISLALALVLALPAGVMAALRPRSALDHAVNLLAFAGFSVPSFWLALLLIIVFAVELGWLPAGGAAAVGGEGGLLERLRYLVLPVATLTLLTAGTLIRFMRAAMLETLREPFIRTARAKGVGTWRLVTRHAMRHAMLPLVTVLALQLGSLFSGALVVETVFAYLGMGKLIYDAILGNDFNLALLALMMATLVTLLANLLADLCYAWLDPRITYDG